MRSLTTFLLASGLLIAACSGADPGPDVDRPGTGGSSAKGGTSGKGTGGSSASGTGGSSSSSGSGGAAAPSGSGGASASGGSSGSGSGGATGSSSGGSSGSGSGGSAGATDAAAAETGSDPGPSAPTPGTGAYAPCPKCKPLFDGKSLDAFNQAGEGAWVIKDGALASTGKAADAWTKEEWVNYRIFFSVRQIRGNHQPGVLFFGNSNGGKPARGLQGVQIQPPNGYTWDYRPGKNNAGGNLFMKFDHPKLDVKQWSQCEALVKGTGEIKFGCCQLTGSTPCKTVQSLHFKDPAAANKKSPFGIQMHNGGLFDEYKDIYVEVDPTVDDLISK
jgi:Domain of Unknown Function (DUF1080)